MPNFSGVQRPRPINARPQQAAPIRPHGQPQVMQRPVANQPPQNPATITAGMQNMNIQGHTQVSFTAALFSAYYMMLTRFQFDLRSTPLL